jgi:hypothetical protein
LSLLTKLFGKRNPNCLFQLIGGTQFVAKIFLRINNLSEEITSVKYKEAVEPTSRTVGALYHRYHKSNNEFIFIPIGMPLDASSLALY